MPTGNIAETTPENGIFSIFVHAVTLTFNLSTPKYSHLVTSSYCHKMHYRQNLVKIRHCIRMDGRQKTPCNGGGGVIKHFATFLFYFTRNRGLTSLLTSEGKR